MIQLSLGNALMSWMQELLVEAQIGFLYKHRESIKKERRNKLLVGMDIKRQCEIFAEGVLVQYNMRYK